MSEDNMGNPRLVSSKQIAPSPLRLLPPVNSQHHSARKSQARRAVEKV
jgi:hypothetical protein